MDYSLILLPGRAIESAMEGIKGAGSERENDGAHKIGRKPQINNGE